ncbi:MAG TPA: twin-arginine translocation signal domain-containing protein, partial [Balneolales bacterium]|nr:twin-arginine translocation signal domain-containing protein [Balneolales bacterium]
MSKDQYHSNGCGCIPASFSDMIENAGLELSRRDFIKGTTVACGMFAAGGVVTSALSGNKAMVADNKADTIYHGGSILTMV